MLTESRLSSEASSSNDVRVGDNYRRIVCGIANWESKSLPISGEEVFLQIASDITGRTCSRNRTARCNSKSIYTCGDLTAGKGQNTIYRSAGIKGNATGFIDRKIIKYSCKSRQLVPRNNGG